MCTVYDHPVGRSFITLTEMNSRSHCYFAHHFSNLSSPSSQMSYFLVFPSISPDLPSVSICLLPLSLPQEFRQKVMLGTPFVVIWLVGFIADLDIDSWLIKGLMYAGMWIAVQFLSKYVSTQITRIYTYTYMQSSFLVLIHYVLL